MISQLHQIIGKKIKVPTYYLPTFWQLTKESKRKKKEQGVHTTKKEKTRNGREKDETRQEKTRKVKRKKRKENERGKKKEGKKEKEKKRILFYYYFNCKRISVSFHLLRSFARAGPRFAGCWQDFLSSRGCLWVSGLRESWET